MVTDYASLFLYVCRNVKTLKDHLEALFILYGGILVV